MLGYIPLEELHQMTIKEWEFYIKGARHRRLDNLEDMRLQSIMIAKLSNGKDIKSIARTIDEERRLIDGNSSKEYEDKAHKKKISRARREVQREALQKWLDSKKEMEG